MTQIIIILGFGALAVLAILSWLTQRRQISQQNLILQQLETAAREQQRAEVIFREQSAALRSEIADNARKDREELTRTVKELNDSVLKFISDLGTKQLDEGRHLREQFEKLTQLLGERFEQQQKFLDEKLRDWRSDNTNQLDQIRATVDEKLQSTLEKRLGDSFKQVSERLEQVHKGLGEMQTLASGVGDLKKVLSNVKTRGTWGEIQLSNLLEQILAPGFYEANVRTKSGSNDLVEFAIKLPGRENGEQDGVWLPIDSKFPLEDYQRLLAAQEAGDPEAAAIEESALQTRIKACAKEINTKYLDPPHTVDFAIMFLPIEGLYAEVLRMPGLVEHLQREQHVVIAGPTTFAALLNSLQMGFKTLAIEKRSSEVWSTLSAVKTHLARFRELLEKVSKNIKTAGNALDQATTRSRTIEKSLRQVQELPSAEAEKQLPLAESFSADNELEAEQDEEQQSDEAA